MGAAYKGILEAADALHRAGVGGDLELLLDPSTADHLLGDGEFQGDLVHPSRRAMPARAGYASIGTLRVRAHSVRVYQRLT